MAKGTTFGSIHSNTNLQLIQQSVEVKPASPKTNFVDIPGGDGSKDLTEALGVGVKYADREITWTFALYPGADWYAKQREVSGALNGLKCNITLDDDPGYYYEGRLAVADYKADRLLRQITVKAICRPYKLKQSETTVSSSLTTTNKTLTLNNDRMPVVPTITVTATTVITFAGNSYTINAGTHKLLGIRLTAASQTLQAKTSSGTGTITIKYREGAL